MKSVETITNPARAATLLAHPVRPQILAGAREPIAAATLARVLDSTRQVLNYHMRQLEAAGFLQPVGQQRRRNMVEQQYVASASAYVISPTILGPLAPVAGADPATASHLLSACAQAQLDLAQLVESAAAAGLRVRTLALQLDVAFESSERRAEFLRALAAAVTDVAESYGAADQPQQSNPSGMNPFRVLLGCYPVPLVEPLEERQRKLDGAT